MMKRCLVLAALSLGLAAPAAAQPSFEQVRAAHRVSDFTLLAANGEALQTLRLDHQRRALAWVALEDMSPALLQA
uniref:hypothetical protein n=1 Tax=Roseateles sp. TaxID=1971397 RepID=UPI00286A3895